MARAKRIYILMIKVKKLFPLLWSRCFLKKIKKNMFSRFLLSYRKAGESLGELAKAVETAYGSCSYSISHSPNFHSCFYFITIRLFTRDFYHVIVDKGAARVNYRTIEISSE